MSDRRLPSRQELGPSKSHARIEGASVVVSCFSRSFVICTDCPPEDFVRALADEVEPMRLIRFSNCRPYQCEVSHASFRIRRIIYYRNPVRPVITGRVMKCGNETRIHVEMRLDGRFVAFFAYATIVYAILKRSA